jgi:hypothetical protein
MFDRRVFTAGIRYAEDIVFGHEDWDLVLQMAERGIEGEAAESAVFMYRKQGFSRVNAVEYGPKSFHERISRRHPLLYGPRREQIKAEWAPALSLVLADGCDGLTTPWRDDLAERLDRQSCGDFEVICTGLTLGDQSKLHIQEIPAGLQMAIESARGRFVLLGGTAVADALSGNEFVEQVIRLFWGNVELSRLVLASAPARKGPRLGLLTERDAVEAIPHVVAWRRGEDESYQVDLGAAGTPIEDVIMRWQMDGALEWRSL